VLPLLQHRQLPGLLIEPGVLDVDGGLIGKETDDPRIVLGKAAGLLAPNADDFPLRATA
jgi:hypothetical protein